MNIEVTGHPRSGNNYLSFLMYRNLWLSHRGNHYRPSYMPDELKTGEHWRILYIWRNFEDVARSFMDRAQGEVSIETFRSTTWNDLYDLFYPEPHPRYPKGKWPGWVPGKERQTMTPEAWWELHTSSWFSFSEQVSHVYVLQYEQLKSDFMSTMIGIAEWLGSDKRVFENTDYKVDGYRVRPGGFVGEILDPSDWYTTPPL